VTARQEGGPKAVLEAMATGVPLVTTRVGQAPEIVVHGENGLLADVDDVEGLVAAVEELHDNSQLAARLRKAGRPTAEAFADERLDERWAALLEGFVLRKDTREVDRARVARYGRAASRWARLLVGGRRRPGLRVFYGHDRVPERDDAVAGGTAKFQRLAERFPNHPADFTVMYLGSTWLPRDLRPLLALARRRRIPIVLNQDGVAYPGWAGSATEAINEPYRRALLAAEHVLYQSQFSKLSADTFLAEPRGSWEVLYNAVDVERFRPVTAPPAPGPVLLLGGDQTQAYRLEVALRTFALVAATEPEARLLVTGRLVSSPELLLDELGVRDRVEFVGRYTQAEAPDIIRRAHLLLHTKVKDPCPSAVIEAMACGLPVVYARSGGTVELVGDDAGIGVEHPDTWDRDEPPAPEALAGAVRHVLAELEPYSAAARARAISRFSLEPWLERHVALFRDVSLRGQGSRRR
jgi:glycosyltransferase involved in cell wall biosynthesis